MQPLHLFMARSLAIAATAVILSAFCSKLIAAEHASDQNNATSSFMRLPLGFNLSLYSASFVDRNTSGEPVLMGTPNLDGNLFFPILSSPSFNSSTHHQRRAGFSLGFYIGYNGYMYVAVCAGSVGRLGKQPQQFYGPGLYSLSVVQATGGFAVPVWIANLDNPIKTNAERAYLVVVAQELGADSRNALALQLKDGDDDQVVWSVPNVGVMEMRDSGELLIYDSISRERAPVFQQSPITDILVEGQRLTVGMQLTSNDSVYSAKMEEGGLALYLNSMGLQAPPYWVFPIFRDPGPHELINPTINQLLSSAPCSNMSQLPYLDVSTTVYGNSTAFDSGFQLKLNSGSCRSGFVYYYTFYSYFDHYPTLNFNTSWSFVRLESDGRLYLHAVSYTSSGVVRYALDSLKISSFISAKDPLINEGLFAPYPVFMVDLGTECDVPLACGALGVCMSGVKSPCSCPDDHSSSFEPNNITDLTQGCKRRTSLPSCSTSAPSQNSTTFVRLNSTASMFFLNGWTLNSNFEFSGHDADACKQACSINCSCLGASYQVSTSSCFLMTSEISLLTIPNDMDARFWNYTTTSVDDFHVIKRVHADDFVTYLRVGLSANPLITNGSPALAGPVSDVFPMMSLIGIVPSSVVVCILLGLGGYHLRRRRRQLLQHAKEEEGLRDILPLLPARFSYRELQEATKGFSKLLGAGGCGSVYAGTLSDGRKVAVKLLVGVFQGSQSKDFLAEVATVGRTGHHNIIRLVGFCWQVSHRLLVYEYAERGSLDRWLFGAGDMLLDWPTRYSIALGVSRGLHYLHEECEQPILHFDIKPQNILLNDAFVAKLADFGMSRLMQRDMSSVMTGVRGTPGYIAPEWFSHGSVSKKSDIYSMGMVMMEIVAGRKVLEYTFLNNSAKQEAWHLPSLVESKCREHGYSVVDLVDKRLHACGFDEAQAQRLLDTALWCSHADPAVRPHAATVVQWLENSSSPIQQPPIAYSRSGSNSKESFCFSSEAISN